jgi:hypothetical protein
LVLAAKRNGDIWKIDDITVLCDPAGFTGSARAEDRISHRAVLPATNLVCR